MPAFFYVHPFLVNRMHNIPMYVGYVWVSDTDAVLSETGRRQSDTVTTVPGKQERFC